MARKPKSKPKVAAKDALINAALVLAARDGWRHVTMAAIAEEAGLSLAEALTAFADKNEVLAGFLWRVDQAVLAGGNKADVGETPRDRLFDILMRRLDALTPHKAGLAAVLCDLRREPMSALCHLSRLNGSMRMMLDAVSINSSGPCGALRAKGLAVIYANTLRVWLDDEGSDQAATMAALDRGLIQAERLMRLFLPGRLKGDPGAI